MQQNRRRFVFGLCSLAAVGVAVPARGQDGLRFRAVKLDTSILEANGNLNAAARLRMVLGPALQQSFASRLGGGPRTPALLVRLNTLVLAIDGGLDTGPFSSGFGSATDSLQGDLVLPPVGNYMGSSVPLLVTQAADSAGAWYLPTFDNRRIDALAAAFAYWAPQKI